MHEIPDYCRDIETYLCRKNDGHLIRITGPSFEVVSAWASEGIPVKVAYAGIDRYFERYYRKGPRRRPVKIDFCDADVRDVFDEWWRATGVTIPRPGGGGGAEPAAAGVHERRSGPSLPEHLERVVLRLSNLRATGALDDRADPLVDEVAALLQQARQSGSGVRGETRRLLLERLDRLDADLIAHVRDSADPALVTALRGEARTDLEPFRGGMAPDAYAAALEAAATRLLRERLRLPTVAFG